MAREELEFLISQYVDGTLVEGERVALETRLRGDDEARVLLAEHEALTARLKSVKATAPAPAVDWDRLAERISAAVAGQSALVAEGDAVEESKFEAEPSGASDRARWRIAPARWLIALAASVLLAAGAGIWLLNQDSDDTIRIADQTDGPTTDGNVNTGANSPTSPREKAEFVIRIKDQPTNRPTTSIVMGPTRPAVDQSIIFAGSPIVTRTPRVLIASGGQPVHNTPASPY